MNEDWTTVVPAAGEVQATARELLSLADDPADVMTQAGGTEFRIPPYLARRYASEPPQEPARARRRSKKEGDE